MAIKCAMKTTSYQLSNAIMITKTYSNTKITMVVTVIHQG